LSDFPPEYLRGIELFNSGQFFDCHEVLEDIWRVATGEEREILHALIQAAVALHHLERGNLTGAHSVLARSIGRLGALPELVMGVETRVFARQLDEYVSDSPAIDRPLPRINLLK
jgi:predicted metal-dependent hydrolase